MLTFKTFLIESESLATLTSRVMPAVHHLATGKIFIGKRGESHEEIRDRHIDELPGKRQYGFHDPKTRKFHPRGQGVLRDLATTSLLSPVQRMIKYGTEECQIS